MIGPSGAVRVLVATRPVDFRKGAEGLAALVRDVMGADPFDGAVYVFRAKRADRVKLVYWDGTGVCLFAKRLEDGRFQWPKIENGVMRLSAAQLSALVEGLDWKRNSAPRSLSRQSAALSYLGAYFSAKIVIAASAAARFSDNQISRKSRWALG